MTPERTFSLTSVTKRYGGRTILDAVCVEFPPASVTALVGPNGAGKTTLLRIAAGLQSADEGDVPTDHAVGYFGGFETMPVGGSVSQLRRGLGLTSGTDTRRLSRLSRGELQRVGLEAFISLNCTVNLLDEPWTGLEPDRREVLSNQIVSLAADGAAVVCSSHDLDEVARIADRLYFLGGGSVLLRNKNDGFDRQVLLDMYRLINSRMPALP